MPDLRENTFVHSFNLILMSATQNMLGEIFLSKGALFQEPLVSFRSLSSLSLPSLLRNKMHERNTVTPLLLLIQVTYLMELCKMDHYLTWKEGCYSKLLIYDIVKYEFENLPLKTKFSYTFSILFVIFYSFISFLP